ncbi:MAG TPA: hypothetical protein H9851_04985 [Candidatus Borkfalkia faecavium]|uniref:Uncharacterized protein n=1 Tax=Candidatus Borkfalkia faecavium TaxID=2838508 RepID=A0A9D2AUQ9_9FIRM|nr:hypothetical protein [Candidatus Borkfalkia faecavium]
MFWQGVRKSLPALRKIARRFWRGGRVPKNFFKRPPRFVDKLGAAMYTVYTKIDRAGHNILCFYPAAFRNWWKSLPK